MWLTPPYHRNGWTNARVSHRRRRSCQMEDDRTRVGALGERIAEAVLVDRGLQVVDRNVLVGRGEIDLICRSGRQRVVVEVRSVRGELRLDERFPSAKRRQVRSLAAAIGIHRVDLVGVAFSKSGIDVHWLRDVPTG